MEQHFETQNGIQIYAYPNEHLHSFCIALYVKAGCLYETDETCGITHFMEHIAFRNIDHIYEHHLYEYLDRYGLTFNACTYKEFVQFSITGSPKYFERAAEILTLVLHPLVLSKEEIDMERQRIKAEIREYDDKSTLDYFTDQIVWEDTPLKNPITGKKKILNAIGKRKLCKNHEEMYTTNHIFFYLTGAVDAQHIHLLSKHAEKYQLKKSNEYRTNTAPIPKTFFKRNGLVEIKKNDVFYVRFSFDIDTSKYTKAELDLFYDVLFSGHSGIIYQELSEKRGLIYSHDASLEQYSNIGNLYFSFEVQQASLLTAIEIIIEHLHKLKKIFPRDLACLTAPYIDNALMMCDHTEDLNWNFAYENHILNCNYADINARINSYAAVTEKRLIEMANEIFTRPNLLLTLKGKKKKIDTQKIKERLSQI